MKILLIFIICLLTIVNIYQLCLIKDYRDYILELDRDNTNNKQSMLKMAKNAYKAQIILQADSLQKRLINY